MGRDLEALKGGTEAKFNAHIALLERINDRQIEADRYSCVPSGECQLLWFNSVKCVERIMWPYLTDIERTRLNTLRPKSFTGTSRNPLNGKTVSTYNIDLAVEIGNWEVAINDMIAKRGLALKSGKDPSMAMIE